MASLMPSGQQGVFVTAHRPPFKRSFLRELVSSRWPVRARLGLGRRQGGRSGKQLSFSERLLLRRGSKRSLRVLSRIRPKSAFRTSDRFVPVPSGHCCPPCSAIRCCRHHSPSLAGGLCPTHGAGAASGPACHSHSLGFAPHTPPRLLQTPSSWLLMGCAPDSALRGPPHPRSPRAD